jgi:hypothetical protein
MMKRKFGIHLYCKSQTSEINKILCLVLAHNICVLIQELFEANAVLNFEDCENVIVHDGYCAK